MSEKIINENELLEVDGGYSPPEYDNDDDDYFYFDVDKTSNDCGGPLV